MTVYAYGWYNKAKYKGSKDRNLNCNKAPWPSKTNEVTADLNLVYMGILGKLY